MSRFTVWIQLLARGCISFSLCLFLVPLSCHWNTMMGIVEAVDGANSAGIYSMHPGAFFSMGGLFSLVLFGILVRQEHRWILVFVPSMIAGFVLVIASGSPFAFTFILGSGSVIAWFPIGQSTASKFMDQEVS